jgi:hypothetical protein
MSGAIPPLFQYAFMAWCLVKHRDFYLRKVKMPLENVPHFSKETSDFQYLVILHPFYEHCIGLRIRKMVQVKKV